jgi:site-specific DNA-cytosine methylase
MLTVLDLCCGTGSVGASFKRVLGDDVTIISLDLLPKFRPTIVAGILTWDYKSLQLEGPLVIWGSPPCTEYSKAKTVGYRNLRLADAIAKKVFEIIDRSLQAQHMVRGEPARDAAPPAVHGAVQRAPTALFLL